RDVGHVGQEAGGARRAATPGERDDSSEEPRHGSILRGCPRRLSRRNRRKCAATRGLHETAATGPRCTLLEVMRTTWLALTCASTASPPAPLDVPGADTIVQLPGGEPGIGLDDLRFSSRLGKLVVAAGRTGSVDLVDPRSLEVTAIGGFSTFAS